MTMIATFMIEKSPFLIGDLLLSSGHVDSCQLALPVNSDISFEATIKDFPVPTGMCQKTALLSDHLAIGWTGNQVYASALLKEIKTEFGDGEASGDDIVEFLKGKENEYEPVSLVGVSRKADMVYVFHFNGAFRASHDVLDNIFCNGSGVGIFRALIKDVPFDNQTHPKMMLSIASLFAGLMGEELRTKNTLLNNFGGGYEVVYHASGQFWKLDELTYCFWSANQQKDGKIYIIGLPIIIKQKMIDDILVIRRSTCEREDATDGIMRNVTSEKFHVRPILRYPPEAEIAKLPMPSLNSLFQCHYIFGNLQNGKSIVGGAATMGDNNVTFIEDQENIEISCPNALLSKMAENIVESYKQSID